MSNSDGVILVYNIPSETLTEIQIISLRMGIHLRSVSTSEYDLPIGFLAGMEWFSDEKLEAYDGFDEEMLIMCGLSGGEINELLDTMKQRGINIPLKALATDTNVKWSSARLHKELSAEWAAFKAMAAKRQPQHGLHKKRK